MLITQISVSNYRGLKDVAVPLSQFGCLIGENNSGKSSVLQAILLLHPSTTRKPQVSDYYDLAKPIRIELRIDGVTQDDLSRISNDQHRASFAPDVIEGSVRLVRKFDNGLEAKSSQLFISKRMPKESRWTDDELKPVMKGKTGVQLRDAVLAILPELEERLPIPPKTQGEVLAARDAAVDDFGDDDLEYRDVPLGTGLDAGIKNFLPEPLYIEAVKDVADEVKTTDTATFGKLLGLLLDEVKDQFKDVEKQFQDIQKKLSRIVGPDGAETDDRIVEVKNVEGLLNSFIKQSFPEVDLRISVPVPKMKTILSSAEISANDGHEGPVVSKGDGLKRAVAFAILRTYAKLRSVEGSSSQVVGGHYWLLFEEPELYLYPRAQRQLFAALKLFADDFPVIVTTHSPIFFDAESTGSFVKFRKFRPEDGTPPLTQVRPISIGSDLSMKTAFQIICHENNSIAFFAKKVILVEGDSDAILLPHIAKLLDPDWDAVEKNVSFARINGKGNIKTYRTFFSKFDIPVSVVCDLDTIVSGFDKLEAPQAVVLSRSELIVKVDALLAEATPVGGGDAGRLQQSGDLKGLWAAAEAAVEVMDETPESIQAMTDAVSAFFMFRRKGDRLTVLTESREVAAGKAELIGLLREGGSHVLSRGAIEEYYKSASKKSDKVRQAIEYVSQCPDIETYRRDLGDDADAIEAELRGVMAELFDTASPVERPNGHASFAAPDELLDSVRPTIGV